MSGTERGSCGSESAEDEVASTTSVAVEAESVLHDAEGSELVSGTSTRRTWSETQSVQDSAGPTGGEGVARPPTTLKDGAKQGAPFSRQMPSAQNRNTPVSVQVQPTVDGQGAAHHFQKSGGTPQTSGLRTSQKYLPSIQERVDRNQHKKGICILSACTNAHCAKESIEPSDAVERMRRCFGKKLGYLVIEVGTTIDSQHLDEVLHELSAVRLPTSYCRVFFYYFGHGTEESLCLADKDVERKYIINQLQSMCPSHPELFKIFLFDSCRSPLTTHPIQVHKRGPKGELGGGSGQTWLAKWKYPSSSNTLVINATDFNCKAYYIDDAQVHGCGLVTLYLTNLAPEMNASLSEVLTEVRTKVIAYIKAHPDDMQRCAGHQYIPQVLVYEDRLMGSVNLLAESTGDARVTPEKLSASPQALNTNVQWRFPSNVENRIQKFIVKVTPDGRVEGGNMYVSTAPNDRFATLSSLEPSTKYHLKVVAEYEDSAQAESEDFMFTTTDRSSPQNIKLQQDSGSFETQVEWSFPGDNAELSCYKVKVEMDGKPSVDQNIHDVQKKRAIFKSLPHSPKYTVTVTAVYKDGIEKRNSEEVFNECELLAATNMSATVIWLDPLKVELEWSYQEVERSPFRTGCTVMIKAVNSITPPIENNPSPYICKAAVELRPGTTYSWKVVTIYGENTQQESKEMEFKTPSEDEVKPKLEEPKNIQSKSVVVTFSNPQFFQKTEQYGDKIKLSGYNVMCHPHGDQEDNPRGIDFPDDMHGSSTLDASRTQPHRIKLSGLTPGKKYKLFVKAHYSNEESLHSNKREFTTRPSAPWMICLCVSTSLSSLAFLLLLFSLVPYHVYLQSSGDCETNYILSLGTIQCGYGNSLQYDGAEIEGCPVSGDVMTETLNVWQIRDDELILHNQTLPPVISKGQTSEHSTFLLLGWEIYTWKDSVIAGFCCIANDNEEEKTVSLYMFRDYEDAHRFELEEGVRDAILSEQIRIPPNKTSCFKKWGANSPFTVEHSSYHYIGVDLPANMNYTANVTVMQTYVNTSDYPNSKPKQFKRDNHTHFTYPHKLFHRTDYLYICEAPLTFPENESEPDSVSLHICTCNHPRPWMKPTFISVAALGGFGILLVLILSGLTCYCRHANHLCQSCPRFKRARYVRIKQLTVQPQLAVQPIN